LHTSGENPKTADRTRIKMVYIKLQTIDKTVDLKAKYVIQHFILPMLLLLIQFLPSHIWHFWLCSDTQADPSQTQKNQLSNSKNNISKHWIIIGSKFNPFFLKQLYQFTGNHFELENVLYIK
jgi:hypothetical protein